MGGDDFEPNDPCDVMELEALKAKVCFVSEDVDKDNAKMGKKEERRRTLGTQRQKQIGRVGQVGR